MTTLEKRLGMTLQADLVYNIKYRGNPHILNLVGFRTILRRSKAISLLSYNFDLRMRHSFLHARTRTTY